MKQKTSWPLFFLSFGTASAFILVSMVGLYVFDIVFGLGHEFINNYTTTFFVLVGLALLAHIFVFRKLKPNFQQWRETLILVFWLASLENALVTAVLVVVVHVQMVDRYANAGSCTDQSCSNHALVGLFEKILGGITYFFYGGVTWFIILCYLAIAFLIGAKVLTNRFFPPRNPTLPYYPPIYPPQPYNQPWQNYPPQPYVQPGYLPPTYNSNAPYPPSNNLPNSQQPPENQQ